MTSDVEVITAYRLAKMYLEASCARHIFNEFHSVESKTAADALWRRFATACIMVSESGDAMLNEKHEIIRDLVQVSAPHVAATATAVDWAKIIAVIEAIVNSILPILTPAPAPAPTPTPASDLVPHPAAK